MAVVCHPRHGDSYDPWGSAHGEEGQCGASFVCMLGVGLAAPDPSSKHAAPGGDSYDPWGSAHGEEDRR